MSGIRPLNSKLLFAISFLFTFSLAVAQDSTEGTEQVMLLQADQFFESGHYDSAVVFYEKYISNTKKENNPGYFTTDLNLLPARKAFLDMLLRLGTCYNMVSEPEKALDILKRCFVFAGSDFSYYPELKALYYYQSGNALLLKMDYSGAIRNYQNALSNEGKNVVLAQKINQNIGSIFFFTEDYDKAIEHFQKSLVSGMSDDAEDPVKLMELLINTGSAYAGKNDLNSARDYYLQAERLLSEIKIMDHDYARLYLSLGNLLVKMNDPDEAFRQFMKALDLLRRSRPVNNDDMVILYSNVARLYKNRMMYDSTMFYLNLAVSYINDSSERNLIVLTNLYRQIGDSYGLKEDWPRALEYYQKALDMSASPAYNSRELTASGMKNNAEILEELRIRQARAKAMYMTGMRKNELNCIYQSYNEFISLTEIILQINERFGREGSRLWFNESVKDLYYNALETGYYLFTHGHRELSDQLFQLAEHSRNKILVSSIRHNIARKSSGIPDSLLKKEKEINDAISLCIRNLWVDADMDENSNHAQYLFYFGRLMEYREAIDSLEKRYERISPIYNKLKEQEMVTDYSLIRQKLLPDQAMTVYFVGDTSLFIFLLRTDTIIIKRISLSPDFKKEIADFNREVKLGELNSFHLSANNLYSRLIHPIKHDLGYIHRLIIIPDENLATIPFEVLVTVPPDKRNRSSEIHHSYLINDFEICYHFSSELWSKESSVRVMTDEPFKYAGFAPVSFPYGEIADTNGGKKVSFSSLPFSVCEIEEVSNLIKSKGGKVALFTGTDATPEKFRYSLTDNDIVHVATHSLIDEDDPGLSGLVFSLDFNKANSNSLSERMVFLYDIYNFNISADLLVLSACATGTGKITRSEGVLAMTRGFYTAGAGNIVYTLWNVTDRHTKDFMVKFFKGIVAGESCSSALRNAKLEMIRKPETSLPRIWAAYILLGE